MPSWNFWFNYPPIDEAFEEIKARIRPSGPVFDPVHGDPLAGIEKADAVFANSEFPGTADTFDRSPRMRVIARFGIGYDNIDVAAATQRGIVVGNTPDAPTESTAEFAVTLILAVARRLKEADRALSEGRWISSAELMGFDLRGRTLGLVGLGRIGGRVAEIAAGFRMRVLAFDPYADPDRAKGLGVGLVARLEDLLSEVDVLSVHAPLGPGTRHLIGRKEFARIKPGAIFINVARGPLVDPDALLEGLRSGRLAGAGLDVWEIEPAPPDNPLLRLPNVVVTPHMAAATREGKARSHSAAFKFAFEVLAGRKPAAGFVNPEVWERRRDDS